MKKQKLTLGQLASLVWTACYDLRDNMDTSEYKESFFNEDISLEVLA